MPDLPRFPRTPRPNYPCSAGQIPSRSENSPVFPILPIRNRHPVKNMISFSVRFRNESWKSPWIMSPHSLASSFRSISRRWFDSSVVFDLPSRNRRRIFNLLPITKSFQGVFHCDYCTWYLLSMPPRIADSFSSGEAPSHWLYNHEKIDLLNFIILIAANASST